MKLKKKKKREKKKKVKRVKNTWDKVKKQKPIWTRKPEEVKPEEYSAFYKAITNDWENELAKKTFLR